jgi:tetratricopeptide (TPR) repeat protein
MRGDGDKAIEHFQRAFDLQQRAGDIHGQATMHNQIANAYFAMSQWQEADRHYRQAHEIFDRIGDVYLCAVIANNLGGIARNQGRLDEAMTFYQESLNSLEQIGGSLFVLGVLYMNVGATFIRRREIDAARQHLRTSQDYYEQAQARDFLPEMHRYFAQAALFAGELTEARAQGDQALRLARDLAMRGEEGCALRILGEVATAQEQLDEAKGYLNESLSTLEELGDVYEGARTRLSLARVLASQAESTECLVALDDCIQVFQRLGATLDLAAARALYYDTTTK